MRSRCSFCANNPVSVGLAPVQDSRHLDHKFHISPLFVSKERRVSLESIKLQPHKMFFFFFFFFLFFFFFFFFFVIGTSLIARTRPHSLSPTRYWDRGRCASVDNHLYIYLPNTWKGFNQSMKCSTHSLGKPSHSKQITSR